MIGPPGAGKTMLARRLPTILPPLTNDEAIEVTRIYSVCGQLPPGNPLIAVRSFRAPHHAASLQALVGGGTVPRPGEVSLARTWACSSSTSCPSSGAMCSRRRGSRLRKAKSRSRASSDPVAAPGPAAAS